jgi:hypothetical protein
MAEHDEQVRQALAAMKAGRKDDARTILLDVVEQDERHEAAWLYLSALVDTLEEQQICLENVLAINPANEKARKGLETVSQKLAAQSPSSTPAAQAPPSTPPGQPSPSPFGPDFPGDFGGGSPAAPAPYDGDTPSGASTSPPFDESLDWFSAEPETPPAAEPPSFDPFAPATSVDWGRDDKPAAYGSGKQVELPSAQEYEDWVQGLNLGGEPPEAYPSPPAGGVPESTSPFVPDGTLPFGDTSFMVDAGPFVSGDQPGGKEQPGPSGGDAFGTPWEGEPTAFSDEGLPGSSSMGDASFPFGGESGDAEEFASPFASLESETPFPKSAETGTAGKDDDLMFSFDDDEDASSTSAGGVLAGTAPAAASAPQSGYFRYIPADIEAAPGGIGLRTLMLLVGVVGLALLNVVSFAYLLL